MMNMDEPSASRSPLMTRSPCSASMNSKSVLWITTMSRLKRTSSWHSTEFIDS
jgi:hypothetical protein